MPIELSEVAPNFALPDLDDLPSLQPERSLSEAGSRVTTVASRYQAVERVILAMRKRLDEPLSLHVMARIALLSPYHFNRVFRVITGIPPGKFLAVLRMEAAKRLLITTQLAVSDVCFGIGYNSLGSFTRDFTKLVGLSPRNLRHLARNASVPWLKRLREHENSPSPSAASGPGLTGRICARSDFAGLIFVGLFTTPLPQGQPVGCALLSAPGSYCIDHVPDGSYYVFAAAFPYSEEPLAYLLPDQTKMYVGAGRDQVHIAGDTVKGDADLTLRRLQLTDPPILITLPLLMAERLSDHGM